MLDCFKKYPDVALVSCKRKFLIEETSRNDKTTEWIKEYQNLQDTIDTSNEYYTFITKDLFLNREFVMPPYNKIGEPSAVMFRKNLTDKIGLFRTDLEQSLDYEYWYRILKHNRICILNEYLVKFRIHKRQASNINRGRSDADKRKEDIIYNRILYKEYYHLLSDENNKILRNRTSLLHTVKRFANYFRIYKYLKHS